MPKQKESDKNYLYLSIFSSEHKQALILTILKNIISLDNLSYHLPPMTLTVKNVIEKFICFILWIEDKEGKERLQFYLLCIPVSTLKWNF